VAPPLLPEGAPFDASTTAWVNGLLAGTFGRVPERGLELAESVIVSGEVAGFELAGSVIVSSEVAGFGLPPPWPRTSIPAALRYALAVS